MAIPGAIRRTDRHRNRARQRDLRWIGVAAAHTSLVRVINHSALVLYSARDMFALVDDIESYPKFLPWCAGATVHVRDESIVEASIEMRRGVIHKVFKTRNTLQQDVAIDIALLGGPFRHLSGGWSFLQLGGLGCKVSLNLEFEFEHRVTDMVFGPYFEDICNSMLDAFTQRAADVYG